MQKYNATSIEKNKNAETMKHEKLQQLADKNRAK